MSSNPHITENIEFWDKLFTFMADKPLVAIAIVALIIWGGLFFKMGRNPFNKSDTASKSDIAIIEKHLSEKLKEHNDSNDKDFQEIRDSLKQLSEDMKSGFSDVNKRIDSLFEKK